MLTEVLNEGDTIDNLTFSPEDLDLDREFYYGFGIEEGVPFWAWSENWVYLCACYDGSEWITSVPRHPHVAQKPFHIGG